jgi:hypothetical protein
MSGCVGYLGAFSPPIEFDLCDCCRVYCINQQPKSFPYQPDCPDMDESLLVPASIMPRNNSKLSLTHQVTMEKTSGLLNKNCFDKALGGTLRSAGFAASEYSDPRNNIMLSAKILEQGQGVSHKQKEQPKEVRLVIEYSLLRYKTKEIVWIKKITTEYEYGLSAENSTRLPDTVTGAFESATRLNLEELLRQLDYYEKNVL